MGIHHSPHTHTIPIPMGIPMGIPIPTAALYFLHRTVAEILSLAHKSQLTANNLRLDGTRIYATTFSFYYSHRGVFAGYRPEKL